MAHNMQKTELNYHKPLKSYFSLTSADNFRHPIIFDIIYDIIFDSILLYFLIKI